MSSREYNSDLAARLREACPDVSLRELAEEMGYNHETIRRYLAGGAKTPAEFLAVVCEKYGASPGWLLSGVRDHPHHEREPRVHQRRRRGVTLVNVQETR